MPLPKDLSGDRWTQRIARHMLPWLIWAAKHHTAVTYGQIDAEVVHRKIHHHVHCAQYGHPAGTIGNGLIEIGEHLGYVIPPLNALVCGKTSRVPGHGCDWYLAEFLGREIDFDELSDKDKRSIVEEVQQRIFEFDRWNEVGNYFRDVWNEYPELKPFKGRDLFTSDAVTDLDINDKPKPKPPGKSKVMSYASGGETENHRRMKEYVASHPKIIGLPAHAKGEIEYPFWSGDRADIVFSFDGTKVAVEIKSEISPDADIYRGLHQCVKYKNLLRAEQIIKGEIPNGRAMLASAGRIPEVVSEHARLLNIIVQDHVNYRR